MIRRLLLVVALLLAGLAQAQELAAIPPLDSPVIDTTGTLDAATREALEQQARALQQRKGSQLQVLVVPTTEPEDIAQYAVRAFEQWRLGREGVDDGVLLVVAVDDRRVRIEVGYGLEGAIPDALAIRIISEYLTPKFRAGDYAGGITDATAMLVKLIDGEPLPAPMVAPQGEGNGGGDWLFALFAALFVVLFIYGWNEYFWPLLITNTEEMRTVVIGLESLIPRSGTELPTWNYIMAGAMMALLPPVAVILFMQRWFVRGLIESEK